MFFFFSFCLLTLSLSHSSSFFHIHSSSCSLSHSSSFSHTLSSKSLSHTLHPDHFAPPSSYFVMAMDSQTRNHSAFLLFILKLTFSFYLLLCSMSRHSVEAKRAIVHIGPHKTGSTYIQRMCLQNAAALHELGFEVPWKNIPKKIAYFAFTLKSLSNQTLPMHVTKQYVSMPNFKQVINTIQSTPLSVIISSEEFDDLGFTAAAKLRSILQDFDVTIVYFHRERTELLRSNYYQLTDSNLLCETFENFISQNQLSNFTSLPGVELTHTLFVFTSVFGRDAMRIISYDGVQQQGANIFEIFLKDAVGIDPIKAGISWIAEPAHKSAPPDIVERKVMKCLYKGITKDMIDEMQRHVNCSEMRELGIHFWNSEQAIFRNLGLEVLYYPPNPPSAFAEVCHYDHPYNHSKI